MRSILTKRNQLIPELYSIQTTLSDGDNIGWSAYGSEVAFGIPVSQSILSRRSSRTYDLLQQIAVKPLPSTRSLPPQYFPTDVFQFTRIDRDDE